MPVRELVEGLWDEADELVAGDQPGMIEDLCEAIAEDVWRAVEALADLGTMTIEEGECSITPLGAWAAVDFMGDDGYDAAVVGELAASDAATVLDACDEMDVEDAAAELAAWIEALQPDEAVRQLAEAAQAGAAADRRAMFFYAISLVGDDGAGAVRSLQADAVLRPPRRAGPAR